jgi:type II secretory pathway component PulC
MARAPTFRHNRLMSSRTLGLGLCVALLGSIWGGAAALADVEHASVVVKAAGKSGSVMRGKGAGKAEADKTLAPELNGGVIPRDALKAELDRGIGRFLQQVRAEPVVSRGRFLGWRLTTLFPSRGDVHVQAIKPGDVVRRVNGQSIERPEDFKALWDGLAAASQLVLEIERDGESSTVRYTIQ